MNRQILSLGIVTLFLIMTFWPPTTSARQDTPDPVTNPPVVAESPTEREQWLKEIDEYAQKVQRDWNVPGLSIAIVHRGEVLLAKGYGTRQLGTEDAVDKNTLFAIASNSKAFTTAALAMLVDEGKLKWDDPVTKYLPRFEMPDPENTREITVRDLVCHRSGLDTFSGDLLWYDTHYSADEVISRIRYLKPVSSFRSRYGYQNLMYIVAGKVLERISGRNWAEFVQSRILDPLEMNRTTTSVDDIAANFAMPHNESGGNGLRVLPLGNVDNCWGACGLNSSAADLAKWMNMHLARGSYSGKTLISPTQIWNLQQPNMFLPISESAARQNPTRHFMAYGLGFFLYDFHGRKVVSHGGGLDGMISQLAMVPEEELGVVVLTNSESSASRFIRDRVLECFLGVEERADRSASAVAAQAQRDQQTAKAREAKNATRVADTQPTISLERFSGKYSGPLYGDAVIAHQDGKLTLHLIPAPNFVADLEHWHYNTFQIKWRDTVKYNFPRGFLHFTMDAEGRPDELVIDQPNNDFWFYELEFHRVTPENK